jgi:hypothetical protein
MTAGLEPQHKSLIIYRTHVWNDGCAREFARLREALSNQYDFVVSGFVPDKANAPAVPDIPCFFSDMNDIMLMGYPGISAMERIQTDIHIDMFRVFHALPDYRDYWIIEFDVRYTGDWGALMAELSESPADVLGTVVQRRAEHPDWTHWQSLCSPAAVVAEDLQVKIFTPMTRLSNAGIKAVDAAYRAGWTGHCEVLWPTVAAINGLLVEDIGGTGSFTPPSRYGRHYTTSAFDPYLAPGSFAYRPAIPETAVPPQPPALWHPVKPAAIIAALPPGERPSWRDLFLLRPVRLLHRRLRRSLRRAP